MKSQLHINELCSVERTQFGGTEAFSVKARLALEVEVSILTFILFQLCSSFDSNPAPDTLVGALDTCLSPQGTHSLWRRKDRQPYGSEMIVLMCCWSTGCFRG